MLQNRPSRKGYLQTGWRIGTTKFQLVNLHLFPDESNLEAMKRSPSPFSRYRQLALNYTLDRTANGFASNTPNAKRVRAGNLLAHSILNAVHILSIDQGSIWAHAAIC